MKGCEIKGEDVTISKSQQEALAKEWRKKGFYGKLHNLVKSIRSSL
jgi:alkyl sulfatase BDS1-like metallo-beta-lactamase superfamily hydrolase